ncbi:MAG TPA: hypothetical protein EYP23_06000 [Thermoplasmata archaeon]|nr:hypothetical protein [Thermoplasmata archaeon]
MSILSAGPVKPVKSPRETTISLVGLRGCYRESTILLKIRYGATGVATITIPTADESNPSR